MRLAINESTTQDKLTNKTVANINYDQNTTFIFRKTFKPVLHWTRYGSVNNATR